MAAAVAVAVAVAVAWKMWKKSVVRVAEGT